MSMLAAMMNGVDCCDSAALVRDLYEALAWFGLSVAAAAMLGLMFYLERKRS
jgi:cytochrome oxidase assembly protein ShyY1